MAVWVNFDVDILRALFWAGVLLLLLAVVVGCTTIGTAKSTLVLAKAPEAKQYHGAEFGNFLTDENKVQLRSTSRGEAFSEKTWLKLISDRFGVDAQQAKTDYYAVAPKTANVSVSIRDLSRTPPLDSFNFDLQKVDEISKLLLDRDVADAKRNELIEGIRNHFTILPEVSSRTVLDRYDDGVALWRYFIELELDFTGSLQSVDPDARFDYLAAAIRIPGDVDARFINFSPKEADLFDLTIGQLKSTGSLTASASQAANAKETSVNEDTSVDGVTDKTTTDVGTTTNYGLNFELTEELTRDIKSTLETRSAGIHDDGKLFLLELKGSAAKRVAGTYTYKLMVEVRSEGELLEKCGRPIILNNETKQWELKDPNADGKPSEECEKETPKPVWGVSQPQIDDLRVETRSIGIVNHTLEAGRTGMFSRVPEPLNDQAFKQVIVEEEVLDVWKFNAVARAEKLLTQPTPPNNLLIKTGHSDAVFYVQDKTAGNEILAVGRGTDAAFSVEREKNLEIVFLPIVKSGDIALEFTADPVSVSVPEGGSRTVVGVYKLGRTFAAQKGSE